MCLTAVADILCCTGMACCKTLCCCCKSCCGSTFKEQIKLAYILLNYVTIFVTMIFCYFLQGLFDNYLKFIECPVDQNSQCLGVSSIYRICFVMMWMYIFLMIFMLIRGEIAKIANEGLWPIKFLFIALFFFGSLFISNEFFQGYVYFSIVISGLFMVFQIIMLIDVFYLWGQCWIKIYDDGGEYMKYILIITTIVLYGGALTLNVFNFMWFSGCGANIFMNIFTIILIVGATGVQLLGWNPQGSLLTSGAMAIYIVFQAYQAQSSWPDNECNSLSKSQGTRIVEIVVGVLLTIVSLLYLTFGTSNSSATNIVQLESKNEKLESQQRESNQDEEQQQLLQNQQKLEEAQAIVKEAEMQPYKTNQYLLFHFIMFITIIYMMILLTNWSQPDFNETSFQAYQPNKLAYWVKMVTSWLAALLYIWTLIAPHIFPDRDFS
ncbi:unnamed protein product [Paramecium sonneborni]|uniref:Serine incorporator n=1 Tax=Paramecium sonneborni TaxID=65129 RepID=A0A8S1LDN6_9CILI|nr:unnamed protein product [Paramecium sonneborni]